MSSSGKYTVSNKVALVTGGAAGIGLEYVKQFLKNGAKGVTIADINEQLGNETEKQLNEEFGNGRVKFVQTDVQVMSQFEHAFEVTIAQFQYVDILVNNAGVLDDRQWEKEIDINLNGTVRGVLLATTKYLVTHRSDPESGLIVNIASVAGINAFPSNPVYTATKFAIVGMTRAFSAPLYFNEHGIRMITVCPGVTETALLDDLQSKNFGPMYRQCFDKYYHMCAQQSAQYLAESVMELIKQASNGSIWIIEGNQPPFRYIIPDRAAFSQNKLPVA